MKQLFFLLLTLFVAKPFGFAQTLGTGVTPKNTYEQAAAVLAQVMNNPQAKKVVLAGILSQVYVDECVLFNDLMSPSRSKAYIGNAYLGEVSAMSFANEFNKVLAEGTYPGSGTIVRNPNLVNDLIATKARVYFPYSENYVRDANYTGNFTCTFYDFQNEDSNTGLVSLDGKTYKPVKVDETYTLASPTLIVTIFEGDPTTESGGNPTTGSGTVTPRSGGDPVDCSQPPLRMDVYIQHFRFESQWDGIFKGGPEFYCGRGDIQYNAAGTHITSSSALTNRLAFKRSHKNEWRNVSTLWDPRWEFVLGNFEELEQHCFVYEDDDQSSTTVGFTGGYKVDAKIPKIGGVEQSFTGTTSHTIQSDDDLVFIQQWDRCWFINTNTVDQGLGMKDGRAARGVGGSNAVKLTMRITPW